MLEILDKAMQRPEVNGNPFALGLSSFTRAARTEAATRASAAWGVPADDLMRGGWFRTAHSVAYRQLKVSKGEVLGNTKADMVWVSEAVGSDVRCALDEDDEEGGVRLFEGDPIASAALNYWGLSRNLVVPLRAIVEGDENAPCGFDEICTRIKMFEQCKRVEHRMDFVDLLSRFAGVRHDPEHGPELVAPDGDVPNGIVGWIFDEAQDASALLDMACRRLLTGESVKWAWTCGDPFQSIFGWAGASSRHFMSWDVGQHQKVMPKSYRCAAPILSLGERCLQPLADYWDRGIAPADHDGEVLESEYYEDDLSSLSPADDTLVIARTNSQVRKMAYVLEDIGVPFRWIKAKKGELVHDRAMGGLYALERGEPVTSEEWGRILDALPTRTLGGVTWLEHGSKARWKREMLATKYDIVYPSDLPGLGATDRLREAIAAGKWGDLVDGGQAWVTAAAKWGVEAVSNPKIRLGTIHSAKGMEADNVILLSSLGRRFAEAEEMSQERKDEGRRVQYVGVTRARRRLTISHDPRERYRMEFPI